MTASFFKELARRTVLVAADADAAVDDAVLAARWRRCSGTASG